jgi:hypothetical protein
LERHCVICTGVPVDHSVQAIQDLDIIGALQTVFGHLFV